VHKVRKWPNLRNLGEPLGRSESQLEAVSFKKVTEGMGIEKEWRMPDGNEFQTVGAARLKPRETKVVRTRGIGNRA